jgi:hypothetical protein
VEILVGGTGGAERELVDPVATETCMGMTIDETRDRREPATVDLLQPTDIRRKVCHRANRRYTTIAAENERVLDDAYIAETGASKWPAASSRRRDLREVTNQHAGHGVAVGFGAIGVAAVGCAAVGAAVVTLAMLGRSSPPSRAASSASG